MTDLPPAFLAHLQSGATTLCRCWRVTRRDGRVYGFTDHDLAVGFGGTVFRPEDGLSARTLEQSTGLSVDNSEAVGILSAAGVTEADILAGRFDGATVEHWIVNWADSKQRAVLFRGEMGEIQRAGGAFKAELRGLTENLNQPQGRVYQSSCPAILGDAACGINVNDAAFRFRGPIVNVTDNQVIDLGPLADFAQGWFENGMLEVVGGPSMGDRRVIKQDRDRGSQRRIVLWEALRGAISPGNWVRIVAGCDKRFETCRAKFDNIVNFRGFPHLPGEDFLMAYPIRGDENSSGGTPAPFGVGTPGSGSGGPSGGAA